LYKPYALGYPGWFATRMDARLKVIKNGNVIAFFDEEIYGMRADEARSAGNQNLQIKPLNKCRTLISACRNSLAFCDGSISGESRYGTMWQGPVLIKQLLSSGIFCVSFFDVITSQANRGVHE
jgi:hypothetical protein